MEKCDFCGKEAIGYVGEEDPQYYCESCFEHETDGLRLETWQEIEPNDIYFDDYFDDGRR